jgi:Amidohydrolase
VGGLLSGRPGIRASGSLREVLSDTPAIDHHAHGILRAPPASLDEFRGLFSESADPRQWPHVATGITYRRAIAVLASHLGCEPTEEGVYARRLATDPREYASALLRATRTELLLVDEGVPPVDIGTSWQELGELAGCPARPGLLGPLIERFAQTTFVLLHCYPFVREAGWLAHVYANVFFDVSLTIPHIARPAQALYEALELAPASKLLYASDASQTPELYLLGSRWWRDALGEVLPALLPESDAVAVARMILRENALSVYRLG